MIRTIVCEKEGCAGNSFYIKSIDNTLRLVCEKCEEVRIIETDKKQYTMLSNCENCRNETFKVFKDTDSNEVYVKCIKCGNPPETVYIDTDGNQVSYNTKTLNDIKVVLSRVDERIRSLENKLEGLEGGQELLEQSLAYVTKFLSK